MQNPTNKKWSNKSQRGASLVLIAASMVVMLGLCALAIDIASFYVARSEAQRSADAAALAGATVFVTSSCTSGTTGCSAVQTAATNEAISVGNKNLVSGVNPNIQTGDVTFNFTPATDPRITVTVQRTSGRGNALPTFFGQVFGISTVDVSATATAEAYNPGNGNGPTVGTVCVKPWLMPNCDPTNTNAINSLCSGTQSYYVNPSTNTIVNPSVIGTLLTIKPGSPGQTIASSQFFPVILPPGTAPAECPTCSNGGGGGNGAALYRQNIECCNTRTLTCGAVTLQPETGNVVGPTRQGVDCLIHEGSQGSGQDILNSTSPRSITGGSNNPNPALVGQTITSSDSIVSAPIYDGAQLCPGKSCAASVTANIVGFMQLFVKDETNPQGTVEAYILNISTCGASAGGGGGGGGGTPGGTVTGGGLSPVPIRLVSQ
jgi:Flp pilus assembly protein TadG